VLWELSKNIFKKTLGLGRTTCKVTPLCTKKKKKSLKEKCLSKELKIYDGEIAASSTKTAGKTG
jgi:hypothetical protein